MKKILLSALGAFLLSTPALAQDKVFVGHMVDYTGATAFVGTEYGPGVRDAIDFVNANGGIDGTMIEMETVDYAYKIAEAIAHYKRWTSRHGMVAMQGWGTADTEALITFVARDKVPVWSASYSAHLTDPQKLNPNTKKAAPYNFFYGPSYSDGCRAMVQWAADDAKEKGIDNPKFVYTGDNHPYPNAPKKACMEFATELGFEVLNPVIVPLKPGDFKAQCLTIKQGGAQYAYVGNLGGSVISLLKSCDTVGTDVTYMANIWGGGYKTIEATQTQGYIFPSASPFWEQEAPGMETVREIAALADRDVVADKPTHHYIRGICSAMYMVDAMKYAKANGGITGENIRKGTYATQDWVPEGMEGVCLPSTWTDKDHRGTTRVSINSGSFVDGKVQIEKLRTIVLPRRADWLGQ